MTLGDEQRDFTKCVGMLIDKIYSTEGYAATLDWAYRPEAVAQFYAGIGVGVRSSLHTIHLAVDLNLFKDGVYLKDSHDHLLFGEWWEEQHPLARWGGRFGDGNHYSFEYGGKK